MSEVNVHAILLADRVIREDNGKIGIIGSFNQFSFPKFPVTAAPWFVYLNMDNLGEGDHEFVLNLVRKNSGQTVMSRAGKFRVDDPKKGIEISVMIPPVTFGSEGRHVLTLLVDGQELGDRMLDVNTLQGAGA